MEAGACFDPTRAYRYSLWRRWQPDAPRLVFIMLNPSTADATTNDATIRRCLQFAQTWHYGSLEVVNLFAFRTSDPQVLRSIADPVGNKCDRFIQTAVEQADRVILAWGNAGKLQSRDQVVLQQLQMNDWSTTDRLACLGRTQFGQPRHPLYLKKDVQVMPFFGAEAQVCRDKLNTQS